MLVFLFASESDVNTVADKVPVEGLKLSFVVDTLDAVIVPDVVCVNTG